MSIEAIAPERQKVPSAPESRRFGSLGSKGTSLVSYALTRLGGARRAPAQLPSVRLAAHEAGLTCATITGKHPGPRDPPAPPSATDFSQDEPRSRFGREPRALAGQLETGQVDSDEVVDRDRREEHSEGRSAFVDLSAQPAH
jgi:hypothetical protein